MRQKFIDKIYMNEVTDKIFYCEKDEMLNGYIAIKYIKQIIKPITYYCNGKKYVGLDSGYTILEYVPLNRNYNCRVFFDNLNRAILFYFDINKGAGIENDIPWYDDLYLDVIVETPFITESSYYIRLDDEKEFKMAKKEGKISEEEFNKGYKIATNLMIELKELKNDILHRCQLDLFKMKTKLNLI